MQSIETVQTHATNTPKLSTLEKARKKADDAVQRVRDIEAKETNKKRKRETRAKIIAGACVLADIAKHPERLKYFDEILRRFVTKPHDYDLLQEFGLMKNLPRPSETAQKE